jgi:tungstate transport system ATP-binding protein
VIGIRDLEVRFGDVTALSLPALDVQEGERLGVRGANGSGKTTLLRVLAGLLRPTAGTVQGLPPPGRAVLVHQRPYLFSGSARDNVVYALRRRGRSPGEAKEWLGRLGAGALADRRAKTLSGGEQRRVAIARALATRPALLLLDEPMNDLDPAGIGALVAAIDAFEGTLVVAAPELSDLPLGRTLELQRTPKP